MARLCDQGHRWIRIDLAGVTFLDAATLRAFVQARRCARSRGGDLVLASARGLPLRVLRMCGFDEMLIDVEAGHG